MILPFAGLTVNIAVPSLPAKGPYKKAEIDTDYGARPLTPSQARFAAKALEDLADCADEKNEE